MRRRISLIATAGALLVTATPAAAATPIDLGAGGDAAAAIDPAGTAHVVYNSPGGDTYCRLPRGAKACDITTALPLEDRSGDPQIFRRPADGMLLIVQAADSILSPGAAFGTTWVWASPDNGANWSAAPIGTGSEHISDAALAADGSAIYTVMDDTPGLIFQRAPLGPLETRTLNLSEKPDLGATGAANGTIVALADGRIVTAIDHVDSTGWRVFGGGDPYAQAAWQPFPAGTIRVEGNPDLATGPRGTYLMNRRAVPAQRGVTDSKDPVGPFELRSLDSKRLRWRAPRAAAVDRLVFGGSHLSEDGGGRLHLVWASDGAPYEAACVVYARTSSRRSSWFGRSTTLFKTNVDAHKPLHPQVAAGADGRGIALWSEQGSSAVPAHVWATPLRQAKGRYRPIRDSYKRHYCK
jgi:hypothetical protein